MVDLLPAGALAEVLGHVREGERGPARQACRALRDAACQAARRLRVACLPAGADGPALGRHAAAVARALRQRPGLEELVLDDHHDDTANRRQVWPRPPVPGLQHALAYLGALGPGGGGLEGGPGQAGVAQPPSTAAKLTLRASWPFGRAAAGALAVALRPGGALMHVRTLELLWVRANGPEVFGHLQRTLPPGLRVAVALDGYDHWRACLSVARWAQAERGGSRPGPPGQQSQAAGPAAGPPPPGPQTGAGVAAPAGPPPGPPPATTAAMRGRPHPCWGVVVPRPAARHGTLLENWMLGVGATTGPPWMQWYEWGV